MVTPIEIACFQYCTKTLEKQSYREKVIPSLTFFEDHVRQAIVQAEKMLIFKDSEPTPRKILKVWDKIWWPACTSSGIPIKQAQTLAVKASVKFSDYCKYDISDYMLPTAAADVEHWVPLGNSGIRARIDLIKVNLNGKKRNINLVDFTRKGLTTRDIILDPAIRATAYVFSLGISGTITYTCIDVSENNEKLIVSSAVFRPEEMQRIREMLIHTEIGITSGIYKLNRWQCKECGICQNFKF